MALVIGGQAVREAPLPPQYASEIAIRLGVVVLEFEGAAEARLRLRVTALTAKFDAQNPVFSEIVMTADGDFQGKVDSLNQTGRFTGHFDDASKAIADFTLTWY